MTHLLVVGGNGFIGQHVVAEGLKRGWDVTILHYSESTLSAQARLSFIRSDITNLTLLKSALAYKAFDYVVNCGGYIDHRLFLNGGEQVFDSHFTGLRNLTLCLDRRVLKSLVTIGSSDEYGNNPAPQHEMMREQPISPYALGKMAASHLLQMLHRTENFPGLVLRLFLTYGPGQDANRFIPQIVRGCLDNKVFPVSQGQQLRDFCYIDDTIKAIFMALETPKAQGEIFNIASGTPVSIKHVIEIIRHLIGRGVPEYGAVAYRPSESMALYADISKASQFLGWKPTITLEDGLQKTITSIKDCL